MHGLLTGILLVERAFAGSDARCLAHLMLAQAAARENASRAARRPVLTGLRHGSSRVAALPGGSAHTHAASHRVSARSLPTAQPAAASWLAWGAPHQHRTSAATRWPSLGAQAAAPRRAHALRLRLRTQRRPAGATILLLGRRASRVQRVLARRPSFCVYTCCKHALKTYSNTAPRATASARPRARRRSAAGPNVPASLTPRPAGTARTRSHVVDRATGRRW